MCLAGAVGTHKDVDTGGQGKIELLEGYSTEMTQVDYRDGEYLLEKRVLQVEERPPMIEVKEYRERFGGGG